MAGRNYRNMLTFKYTNIFSYNPSLSSNQIGLNALNTKLLPFQFKRVDFSTIDSEIVDWKLINGSREIDLSADISEIDILSYSNDFYYIFDGTATLSSTISCGTWQMYFEFGDGSFYYSNYFNIIETYIARLYYFNSKDFNNRIYQYGYKNILYIDAKIISEGAFRTEKIIEKGDGSKKYEYQNTAETYSFAVFGDHFLNKELELLPMFDTSRFEWSELGNESTTQRGFSVFDRPEYESTFQDDLLNYKGKITVKVNAVDKTLCESNLSYTIIEGQAIITIDGETERTTDDGTTIRTTN